MKDVKAVSAVQEITVYEMVAFPVATAVTSPVLGSTVAILVLDDDQVPPASPELLSAEVSVGQILVVPPIVPASGAVITFTRAVSVAGPQPNKLTTENVMIVVPPTMPVTTPVEESTVAMDGAELDQVTVPELAVGLVRVSLVAGQILPAFSIAPALGNPRTITEYVLKWT